MSAARENRRIKEKKNRIMIGRDGDSRYGGKLYTKKRDKMRWMIVQFYELEFFSTFCPRRYKGRGKGRPLGDKIIKEIDAASERLSLN